MTIELDPDLLAWTRTAGGASFCAALRKRLQRSGKIKGWLTLPNMDEAQRDELMDMFGDTGAVDDGKVHLDKADAALRSKRFDVDLRRLLIGTGGPIITQRGRKRYENIVKRYEVMADRAALVARMEPVPQLDGERRLLEALPPSTTRQVPAGSATGAAKWSTYEAAIKAAAWWWPRWRPERKPPWERQVATNALGGSKKWTVPQLEAFAKLVGVDIRTALRWPDAPIRVAGSFQWTHREDVVADAGLAHPWIDVPARGVLAHGGIRTEARGVLLVENATNFADLGERRDVLRDWLIVWTEGTPSKGLVPFLRRLDFDVIAAWCDLDPPGIEIVDSVQQGLDRTVVPIGMEPHLWAAGEKLVESQEKRADWRNQAAALAMEGPPLLRPLAEAIATTGERCEQEGIIDDATPTALAQLRSLLA